MIWRKIEKRLEDFYAANGRYALLIDGARRVGKSYIVEEFAKQHYKSYILIDFNQVGSEITDLFDMNLRDLDSFFMYLSAGTIFEISCINYFTCLFVLIIIYSC